MTCSIPMNNKKLAQGRLVFGLGLLLWVLGACQSGIESTPGYCGDATVDDGETCDGNCPTSCDDTNPCTQDQLTGSDNECNVECLFTQISACMSGDECCPEGCDRDADDDCPDCPAAKNCTNTECGPDPICELDCGSCSHPPVDRCRDDRVLIKYPAIGTCNGGSCDYQAVEQECLRGCEAGACRQCEEQVWDANYSISDATTMAALAGYTEVSGTLTIRMTVSGIEDLSGLGCLERIDADFIIADNQDLVHLSTLDSLFSIGGDLLVYGNQALESMNGLDGLEQVQGSLSIGIFEPIQSGNAELKSLSGLGKLGSIGSDMFVQYNDKLANLDGLANLTSIGGSLFVFENAVLDNLDGFASLEHVGMDVRLGYNDSLVSLDGLSGLTEVPGELAIGSIPKLETLSGLDNITSANYVWLTDLSGVINFRGLDGLTIIHDSLAITRNPRLFSFLAFGSLKTIGGHLQIVANPKLYTPTLIPLESIGGILEIRDNDGMTSLGGLNSLVSLGNNMNITDNASLPTCEAEEFRDRLLSLGWSHDANIAGNDDGGICD